MELPVLDIVSMAYRDDQSQVLVGSTDGTLVTLRVSITLLEHLLEGPTILDSKGEEVKDHDQQTKVEPLGPAQQDMKIKSQTPDNKAKPLTHVPSQVAQVEWQSTYHTGAILAIGTLRFGCKPSFGEREFVLRILLHVWEPGKTCF